MKRANLCARLVALSLVSLAWSQPGQAADELAPSPNIVWIVADDMSPDLGAYGDPVARTPHLDRLAAEGQRFDRAFSIAGVCAPSRSALVTGQFPTTIGTHHMRSWGVPPPSVKAFPMALRRAGYYTSNNAKIDYNLAPFEVTSRLAGQPEGEDVRRSVSRPPLGVWDESGREAHWRNRPDAKQPFFAVFDVFVTHESRIRLPENAFQTATAQLTPADRQDPEAVIVPPYYPDTRVVRADLARYYELVTAADLEVGRILAELEEDGLAQNTVVLFFADHGRGLPRAKRWLWDSGIRVPLLVRWPGVIEAGTVSGELVSFVDFAPTMLALAGAKRPPGLPGRVFLGPETEPEPEFVFAARDRMDETYDLIRAVRSRRYKYLLNAMPRLPYAQHISYMDQMPTMQELRRLAAEDGGLEGAAAAFMARSKPPEEFYDLEVDPDETHNLAAAEATLGAKEQAQLDAMREALRAWKERTGDLGDLSEGELLALLRPPERDLTVAAPVVQSKKEQAGAWEFELRTATEGAAIVWRVEGEDRGEDVEPAWKLYNGRIAAPQTGTLRARAGRLGYYDSRDLEIDLASREGSGP